MAEAYAMAHNLLSAPTGNTANPKGLEMPRFYVTIMALIDAKDGAEAENIAHNAISATSECFEVDDCTAESADTMDDDDSELLADRDDLDDGLTGDDSTE